MLSVMMLMIGEIMMMISMLVIILGHVENYDVDESIYIYIFHEIPSTGFVKIHLVIKVYMFNLMILNRNMFDACFRRNLKYYIPIKMMMNAIMMMMWWW